MKRILMFVSLLLMPVFAFAGMSNYPNGIAVANQTQESAATVATGAGDMYVADDIEAAGSLTISEGIVNIKQTWTDVPTASTMAYITTVAGISVATTTLVNSGIAYTHFVGTNTTNIPRNAVVRVAGGVSAITGTVTLVGTNARGESETEIITLNGVGLSTGAVAWANIASVTFKGTTCTATGAAKLFMGTGAILGLTNGISAYTDVYKNNENAVNKAVATGNFNSTYDTYNPTLAPNASYDYEVWYKCLSR